MTAPPNPALALAIQSLTVRNGGQLRGIRIADQGCGKLRHYRRLVPLASELFLVDTEAQLTTSHQEGGRTFTIDEFADRETRKVRVLRDTEFARTSLRLDGVFSVAVFDVVTRDVRLSLIAAAYRNLRSGGWFVVIIPRNDSSILGRCTTENKHGDGHLFAHHGVHTFFRNFRDLDPVVKWCRARGFALVDDLSSYRQVCLLFAKE